MAYKDNRFFRARRQSLSPDDHASYVRLSEAMTPRICFAKMYFERAKEEEERKRKKKLTDKDAELIFLRRAQDRRTDAEIREKMKEVLLVHNMPLIFRMATYSCANYGNFRIPYEDYFATACSAFHDAILRYDFNRGEARLGNYAIFLIRDQIRKLVCLMSPTAAISNLYFTEHKKRSRGLPYKKHVLDSSESLIFAVGGDERSEDGEESYDPPASGFGLREDDMFSADEEDLDRLFEQEETEALIESALETLDPEERDAVGRTYGVDGCPERPDGVKKEALRGALSKIRFFLENRHVRA